MDFNGIRRLYLPLRPEARFSPGRKTPPGVPAPSTGLRPLNVSRVKCGDGPCRGHSVLPCARNTICLQCAFFKLRRGHGSPPVLGEVPHELSTAAHSKECKRFPQQFIPAGFPPPQPTSHGDGRLSHLPHHTGHGPFRTRPPTSVKSPLCFSSRPSALLPL